MDDEGNFWTPTRKLIEHMPNSAEYVFNRCIKIVADKEEYSLSTAPRKAFEADDFSVRFRYEFLDDDYKVREWYKAGFRNVQYKIWVNLMSLKMMPHANSGRELFCSEFKT